MSADEIINTFKDVLIKIATEQIMSLLIKQASFFGWAVINPVVAFVVGQIVSLLVKEAEIGAFFIRTDILTTGQASNYLAAQLKLSAAKSDEERAIYEKEVINCARNLIKFSA